MSSIEASLQELEEFVSSADHSELYTRLSSYPAISHFLQSCVSKDELTSNTTEPVRGVYMCSICSYGSLSYAEFSFHKQTHTNKLRCGMCDYSSKTKALLTKHMEIHRELTGYECDTCSYITSTSTSLRQHTQLIHTNVYIHSCTLCGFSTNDHTLYDKHQLLLHPSTGVTSSTIKSTRSSKQSSKAKAGTKPTERVSTRSNAKSSGDDSLLLSNHSSEEVTASYIGGDSQTLIQESVSVGGDNTDTTDRAPWWDTANQMNPPTSTSSNKTSGIEASEDTRTERHCQYCGEYYPAHTKSLHQCKVVKSRLSTKSLHCTMCDFTASTLRELTQHTIDSHMRQWPSLRVTLGREDIITHPDQVCLSVERYMPYRFKQTADSIFVRYYTSDSRTSTLSLHRCTKCYKCYQSIDLLAGHKLLDQCNPIATRIYECRVCGISMSSSDEYTAHHLQYHTTIEALPASSDDHQSNRDSFTENTVLMVNQLHKPDVGADNKSTNTDGITAAIAPAPGMIKANIIGGAFEMHCQLCGFKVNSNTDKFMEHLPVCGTKSSGDVTCHMTTVYACSICEYISDKKEELSDHMITHSGSQSSERHMKAPPPKSAGSENEIPATQTDTVTDNQYLCATCGFSTDKPSTYRYHLQKHNDDTNTYRCTECDFTSKHSSNLTIHMRSHTGYRPFVCSMCGKGFITNSELRKHERRHAGLITRNHTCDICSKAYATVQHLRIHMRRHSGDRPFKCNVCDFAATSKSVLVNHMPTHTGEKNYKCHICNFTCASSGTLSNHRRLKHNIVNKRKTLAETTPESILSAAEVAGKSRRVSSQNNNHSSVTRPGTDDSLSELPHYNHVIPISVQGYDIVQANNPQVITSASQVVTSQMMNSSDYVMHGINVASANNTTTIL